MNVLFLCTGNSARSILAEALLAELGKERFSSFSAGSTPKDNPHPTAIKLLNSKGIDTSGFRSKSWLEFSGDDAPDMDVIFTVCDNAAGEACPIWPGHPMTFHWGLEDPAAVEEPEAAVDAAFAEAYEILHARISAFVEVAKESTDSDSLRNEVKRLTLSS